MLTWKRSINAIATLANMAVFVLPGVWYVRMFFHDTFLATGTQELVTLLLLGIFGFALTAIGLCNVAGLNAALMRNAAAQRVSFVLAIIACMVLTVGTLFALFESYELLWPIAAAGTGIMTAIALGDVQIKALMSECCPICQADLRATHSRVCPECNVNADAYRYAQRHGLPVNACKVCGYDLTGLPSSVCPECGNDSTSTPDNAEGKAIG